MSPPSDMAAAAVTAPSTPAKAAGAQPAYQPRRPERTVLYQVVSQHMETLFAEAEAASEHGAGYPTYVRREFERYLRCGIFSCGFTRIRCESCGHERILAHSCKARVCPSCAGRRMADCAAHLVDHVLPEAPYRLWTLSLPHDIRLPVIRHPHLLSRVIQLFLRAVFADQRRRAREQGVARPLTGAVTMIQLWGSILQLTPHAHSWLPDGVFEPQNDGTLRFHRLDPPTDAQVAAILEKTERRVLAACEAYQDTEPDDDEQAITTAQLEASQPALFRIPFTEQELARPRCAFRNGFSLHADLAVHQKERKTLERLLRYGLRPPFAQKRLSLLQDGRVRLKLRKPYYTGQTDVVFEPVEFLRRLAAAIPKPRQNMVRFHGIFASNAKHRAALKALIPPPRDRPTPSACHTSLPAPDPWPQDADPAPRDATPHRPTPPTKTYRRPHVQLHARIFQSDLGHCPHCSGEMKPIQVVKDPDVIHTICEHLGLPTTLAPVAPARAPPQDEFPFDDPDPAVDDI